MAITKFVTLIDNQTISTTQNSAPKNMPLGANRACLYGRVGTVTGGSPTLDTALQFSLDDGLNWFPYSAISGTANAIALTQLITSNQASVRWLATVGTGVHTEVPLFTLIRAALTVGGTTTVFNNTVIRVYFDEIDVS